MATKTTKTGESYEGFTTAERDAMKQRAKELKAATRTRGTKVDPEPEVLAKLAEMPEEDRIIGEWLHAIIKAATPELSSKLWYGMPAYTSNGKTVCHYQPAGKFGTRYGMICFSDVAQLDDGDIWATSFAVPSVSAAAEKKIIALLQQAVR